MNPIRIDESTLNALLDASAVLVGCQGHHRGGSPAGTGTGTEPGRTPGAPVGMVGTDRLTAGRRPGYGWRGRCVRWGPQPSAAPT